VVLEALSEMGYRHASDPHRLARSFHRTRQSRPAAGARHGVSVEAALEKLAPYMNEAFPGWWRNRFSRLFWHASHAVWEDAKRVPHSSAMTASSVQLRSNHVKSSHDRWIIAIGVFKLAQAALFILLGIGAIVCCIGPDRSDGAFHSGDALQSRGTFRQPRAGEGGDDRPAPAAGDQRGHLRHRDAGHHRGHRPGAGAGVGGFVTLILTASFYPGNSSRFSGAPAGFASD